MIKKEHKEVKQRVVLDEVNRCYVADGVKLKRVTEWLEQFKRPFDSFNVAIGMRRAANIKGEKSLTPVEQVKYWNLQGKRAVNYGTAVHTFAEMYDMDNTTLPISRKEKAVVSFINDTEERYELIGNELRCFNKAYGLGGTIDRLLRDKKTGKYIIMDWKTSKEIDKSYNKLNKPFNMFDQSKRNEYSIQLTTYQLLGYIEIEEKVLKLKPDDIQEMWLVILNDNGTYTIEIVETDFRPLLEQVLEGQKDYEQELKDAL